MFDFLVSGKQKRAQALLTNRVNKRCMEDVLGPGTVDEPSLDVKAMIVIPGARRAWQFEAAVPMLASDISASGMCLLHNQPLSGDVLVEMQDEGGRHYVRAAVKYCEALGYNHHRIGVEVQEVVQLSSGEAAVLEQQRASFAPVDEMA